MLTPIPFDMGLVIMGNNQVAFDAVCCHIIGLDPMSVPHIRMCHERGFGPVDLSQIRIEGDLTLEQAQARAQGFRVGLVRVEEYFEGTNIKAHAGPPPSDKYDYCWGGCPGAMEEAIEILRLFDHDTDEKIPPTHLVFGAYDGPLDVKEGERVVLIGDCATFHNQVDGEQVDFESEYVDRSEKSVYDAKAPNIFSKMVSVNWHMWKHRKDTVFRVAGCPVSVAEQVLLLVKLGKLKNPYLDPATAVVFNNCYFSSRVRMAISRMFGNPYQRSGPSERGEARPVQNLPPEERDAIASSSDPAAAE